MLIFAWLAAWLLGWLALWIQSEEKNSISFLNMYRSGEPIFLGDIKVSCKNDDDDDDVPRMMRAWRMALVEARFKQDQSSLLLFALIGIKTNS